MNPVKHMKAGLRENWRQFTLLVIINAFVGSMVGLERSVIPGFAKAAFDINANSALLSFVAAFGTSKALSNLMVGRLAKKTSRKMVLLLGWIVAMPVPFLLMYATSWNMVLAANVLLGINQGLAWSSTVLMKIDIAGQKNRGLAMGINEFAGYLAVGLASFLASTLAAKYGFIYFPFIPGIVFSTAALLLTIFVVKDTTHFVHSEAETSRLPVFENIWQQTTWKHENLGTVTINGFINNLNDGVIWGLLPVLLMHRHYSIQQIGLVAGIYPAVWGMGQLLTGKLGDTHCKKQIITTGMLLQALALSIIVLFDQTAVLVGASALLGIGTALVYPNFLTVIAENTHPLQRAGSMSIFRFWRDSGYVAGALLSGLIADRWGLVPTFLFVAMLTAAAALLTHIRMCCTARQWWKSNTCAEVF